MGPAGWLFVVSIITSLLKNFFFSKQATMSVVAVGFVLRFPLFRPIMLFINEKNWHNCKEFFCRISTNFAV